MGTEKKYRGEPVFRIGLNVALLKRVCETLLACGRSVTDQGVFEFHNPNGWTNYETWCVHLWLSNDEASCHAAREAVEAALPDCDDCDGTGTRSSDGTEDLDCPTCGGSGKGKPDSDAADAIKELVENAIPDLSGSMAGDLLHAALSEVDWLEVAEAFAPEEANA